MMARVAMHVCRRPGWTVVTWLALATLVTTLAPTAGRLADVEPKTFLPSDQPYQIALALERDAFPETAARSRTVVIFERTGGLTSADHAHIAELAARLAAHDSRGESPWRVLSPATQPFLKSRLVSADNAAAMIVVSTDTNWVTAAGKAEVDAMARIVRATPPPDGLAVEITGQGGLGRDLGAASEHALHRTTWVTVAVVLVILLLAYRSPLAALVPLLSIGLTVVVTMRILDTLSLAGWAIGTMERTFAVVLIYGSGTDFAMFWIARYRELVEQGGDRSASALTATTAVAPAIIASAGTTIAGLSTLALADFLPSSNAGRVLAIALTVSLVGALTLIPAVAHLMGRWLFWPAAIVPARRSTPRRHWSRIAGTVVRYPVATAAATLIVLSAPVVNGFTVTYRYDGLTIAPPDSSTARGQAIAERHFSTAQLYSWSCLVEMPTPQTDLPSLVAASERIADALAEAPGVADVWSFADPLGRQARTRIPKALLRIQGKSHYVSKDGKHLRFEVMEQSPPYSNAAMQSFEAAIATTRRAARDAVGASCVVRASGMTPNIVNIKNVTDRDHRLITVCVAIVILVILFVWIRRLFLPLVMFATTLIVYNATLGISDVVFRAFFDVDGIDWKVRLILFVILVAVGQDFNIFLVSRVLQEHRDQDPAAAVYRGLVHTGPVITSCGLIVAATFGSMLATGLMLYQQLGFAFSVGVLLFTFVIRPFVIPSLYLLIHARREKTVDSAEFLP